MCERLFVQILHFFSIYLMHKDQHHTQSSFSTQARPEGAFTQLLLLLLDPCVSNSVFNLPNTVGKEAAAMTSKATPAAIVSLPLQCEEQQCSEAQITFLTCPMKAFPEWQMRVQVFIQWLEGGWRSFKGSVKTCREWKKDWTEQAQGGTCSSRVSSQHTFFRNILHIYTFILVSHLVTPGIEESLYCARYYTNYIYWLQKNYT